MRGVLIVLRRDMAELRRSTALAIVIALFGILTIGAVVGASLLLRSVDLGTVQGMGARPGRPAGPGVAGEAMVPIVGFVVYFATMLPYITIVWAFGATLMIREKAAGNLETLLATPLGPLDIWLGKSLAIFLPAYALATGCALAAVVAINVVVSIWQGAAVFVLPPAVWVTGLLVNPLFFFGLTSLTIILAFTHDPDVGIVPSFPIGFGLMAGVPLGVAVGVFDLAAWSFVLYGLGAAALLWAPILYLARSLTKERVVVSSRNG